MAELIKIYRGEEIAGFLEKFQSRRMEVSEKVESAVGEILARVRNDGDAALCEFALQFDGADLSRIGFWVSPGELEHAHKSTDRELLAAIREARENIERFHRKSLPQSWFSWEEDNVVLGQRIIPLERVGVYVPGGRAAYPSSLLMGVVPAQVAGVKEIIVATPCNSEGKVNSTILATAAELGIEKVVRVGGAQAVAALAFGTEAVPRVDKIVGPGNIYVATAKKLLYGQCGIDMVAGPSEVLIIADESAEAAYVAADLLAQAEHDPLASAILLTDSPVLAAEVAEQVQKQAVGLQRAELIQSSLISYGGIIIANDLRECIDLCNRIAPEHLGLHVKNAWEILGQIRNAGAIFLGSYAPETVGDYWAGPNHILPTNGSARFFSPLRAEDFLKTSSVISYSREALQKHGESIVRFAESEGLGAHANAITIRVRN
jgi:histidinol dehydrogenase